MTPRDDMNNLLNHALEKAGELLADGGHFQSFGAGLKPGGEVTILTANAEEGVEVPDPVAVHEAVQQTLQSDAQAGVYEAVFSCTDGAVTGDDGEQVDAIVVRLEHKEHEPVLVALPYWQSEGQLEFGELGRAPSGEPLFFTAAS